jgi:plastocyanin
MTRIAALLAAAAMLAFAGCGSDDNTSSSSGGGGGGGYGGQSTSSKSSSSKSGEADEIELDDNYFEPKTITGKPGSKMTVELKNEGQAEHTFTIDSQKIDKELEGGEDAEVSFTIPKAGSVEFYCKYHKAAGMVGKLAAS